MKRIYYWILAVITAFGILPVSAQDESNVQFTINVPNPEAVMCTKNGEPYKLEKGRNVFDVPQNTSFYFTGIAPWKLTGVTDKNGTAASGFNGDSWYLWAYPEIQNMEYTLELTNLDEFRTAQFTLNVDDPSMVYVVLGGYFTTLNLKAGENIIKYDPAKETYVNINPAYERPPYSVKLNGVEVAATGDSYQIMLEEDCVIDIVSKFPDEDRTVIFSYSEGAEGSISISVENEPVTDWNGKSIVVKCGNKLTIYGNTIDYNISEVKVNGQIIYFYGSYSFFVKKDSEVSITARPYGSIKATIVIPNTDLVTIYKGYYHDEELPMNQGENIIELSENNSVISWDISNMAIINSITLNGEQISSNNTYWTLNNGDVLVFDVTEKVFDKKAVVWIDDVKGKACSMYINLFSDSDHSVNYTFENGYNFIDFYGQMNPFSLTWYGQSEEIPNVSLTGKAYLNGKPLKPMYEGSSYYNLNLANNDVLKLFMDTNPVECKVGFDIQEGIEANVVKDIVTVVENPAAGFNCFAGTQVCVAGKDIIVTVNGNKIEAKDNEEGMPEYTFDIADTDTKVAVTAAGSTGVSINDVEYDADVYNMQGMKVGKKSQIKTLTPGIYIVNGKKAIVR